MMWLCTLALIAGGCEKKKSEPTPATNAGGTPGGGGGGGAAMTKHDEGDPAEAGEVRPPTADDLAEYTKDLPGQGDKLLATIETPLGTIHCELFADKAPMTVANFIGLATGKKPWLNPKTGNIEKGVPYFDGLTFHRVIPEFMIQGGDPLGVGRGGPGYQFADELSPDLDMGPGTLAMANAGPVTNGSQFFIMENASRPDLAKKHSIFGHCNELDVVTKITGTPRGPADRPETPVTMKVTISKS